MHLQSSTASQRKSHTICLLCYALLCFAVYEQKCIETKALSFTYFSEIVVAAAAAVAAADFVLEYDIYIDGAFVLVSIQHRLYYSINSLLSGCVIITSISLSNLHMYTRVH